jgi:hypothetical protein
LRRLLRLLRFVSVNLARPFRGFVAARWVRSRCFLVLIALGSFLQNVCLVCYAARRLEVRWVRSRCFSFEIALGPSFAGGLRWEGVSADLSGKMFFGLA